MHWHHQPYQTQTLIPMYKHFKQALFRGFSTNNEEDRQSTHESLSQVILHENLESINELTKDTERLLDKAFPSLPAFNINAKLWCDSCATNSQCFVWKSCIPVEIFTKRWLSTDHIKVRKLLLASYYLSELMFPLLLLIRFQWRMFERSRRSTGKSVPAAGLTECLSWPCGRLLVCI